MQLTSPAYRDGDTLPARFAAAGVTGGTGASVPLAWSGAPAGTRSLVLALVDTHPVAHGWVHWLVTGIPPETVALPEAASLASGMPAAAVEHPNTGGSRGYGGPRPPAGSGVHDYVAHLYALDTADLDLEAHATWEQVRAAMSGHVLDSAELVGRFGR